MILAEAAMKERAGAMAADRACTVAMPKSAKQGNMDAVRHAAKLLNRYVEPLVPSLSYTSRGSSSSSSSSSMIVSEAVSKLFSPDTRQVILEEARQRQRQDEDENEEEAEKKEEDEDGCELPPWLIMSSSRAESGVISDDYFGSVGKF